MHLCHLEQDFCPLCCDKPGQSPPAVTRERGGRGEGEGTVLSWRHGVRGDEAWLLKGFGVTGMALLPSPSFPPPQSAICVGLAGLNARVLSYLKESIHFLENSLEMNTVFM